MSDTNVSKHSLYRQLTLAVGCSRAGHLAADHAGSRLEPEGRTASCSPAAVHNPAGHTAAVAGAAGTLAAGSHPGHIHPVGAEVGRIPAAGTAAAGRSPGCIGRSQTS